MPGKTEEITMITIEQMIDREVQVCLSGLVSTVASGYGMSGSGILPDLVEQAFELVSAVDDYEEAAIQAGWRHIDGDMYGHKEERASACNWQDLCEANDIDPYQSEVYEHWAVSPWLAEKLIAAGEKVDTDFAGLNVWARTTTGQQISADGVIARIYADMIKA